MGYQVTEFERMVWGFVPFKEQENKEMPIEFKDTLIIYDDIPLTHWIYLLSDGNVIDLITYGVAHSEMSVKVREAADKEFGFSAKRKIEGIAKVADLVSLPIQALFDDFNNNKEEEETT